MREGRRYKSKKRIKKLNSKKILFFAVCFICIIVALFDTSTLLLNRINKNKTTSATMTNVVRIADKSTVNSYNEFMTENGRISGRYNGRIWTDKSVYSYDETKGIVTLDNKFTITFNDQDQNEDFLEVFSALGSSQVVNNKIPAPIDVVMLIDVSSSMGSANRSTSRMSTVIQAADNAIKKLMDSNENARVGIVLFDGNAFILAPLKHYERVDGVHTDLNTSGDSETDPNADNVETTYYYLSATGPQGNCTVDFMYKDIENGGAETHLTQKTENGTNIQAAYYVGMKMLEDETDLTVEIDGNTFNRIPSVIMFSDGSSSELGDYSTWWAPSMLLDTKNTDQGDNWHGSQNVSDVIRSLKPLMTAAYMKKAVGRHYKEEPTIYTIGLELSNIRSKLALNPNAYLVENAGLLPDLKEGDKETIETAYKIWDAYKKGESPRYFKRNYDSSGKEIEADDYTFYHPYSPEAYDENNPNFKRDKGDKRVPYDNPYGGGDTCGEEEYTSDTDANTVWYSSSIGLSGQEGLRNGPTPGIKLEDYSNPDYDINSLSYVEKYYDAKGEESINEIFDNIVNEISVSSFRPVGGETSGSNYSDAVTYIDPIGKYMKVKDIKEILLFGREYKIVKGDLVTEEKNGIPVSRQYYKAVDIYGNDANVSNPNYTKDSNFDLSEIIIYVEDSNEYDTNEETKIDSFYDEAIHVTIPSKALPIQLDTITVDEKNNVESFVSTTGDAVLPLRLIYTVGISDSIKKDGYVDLTLVSKEYLEKNKNIESIKRIDREFVYFYANYYSAEDYDEDGVAESTYGNAMTIFSPSSENRFYVYQKNLTVYKNISGDNNKGEGVLKGYGGNVELTNEVTTMEEIENDKTYYITIDYYDPVLDEEGKQVDKQGKLVQYAIARKGSEFYQDGESYITYYNTQTKEEVSSPGNNVVVATKKGGKRVSNLNSLILEKGENNKTNTATYFYVPRYAKQSDTETYTFINYMGNNGRIAIEDETLNITKKIDTSIAEDTLQEVYDNKEFKFKLYLEGAEGIKNVIVTQWNGSEWALNYNSVSVVTNNDGYILDSNGAKTEYWVGNGEKERKVGRNGYITTYKSSKKDGQKRIYIYQEDGTTPLFKVVSQFDTKELNFNETYEDEDTVFGVAEFTLRANEGIILSKLTSGLKYIVEEVISEYEDGFSFKEITGGDTGEHFVDNGNKKLYGLISVQSDEANFVNKYDEISIKATKVWDDNGNSGNTRPDQVKLYLLANGKKAKNNAGQEAEVIISSDNATPENSNEWEYTFEHLSKYDENGNEIEYSLEEQEVQENDLVDYYQMELEGDKETGFRAINRLSEIIAEKKSAVIVNGVEREGDLDSVKEGDIIRYTINIKNNVENTKNIKIIDKIPKGTKFKEGSITLTPAYSSQSKVYTEDDLTNIGIDAVLDGKDGEGVTLTFEVIVTGEELVNDEKIENTAIVKDGEKSKKTNIARNTYMDSFMEATKTSRILREPNDGYAVVGDIIEYTITVKNTGNMDGTANIKDKIPVGTTYVEESLEISPSESVLDKEYSIDTLQNSGINLSIKKEEYVTIKFNVRINIFAEGESNKKLIKNIATLDDKTQVPSNEIEVQKAKMVAHKTSYNAGSNVKNGDVIEYRISVKNEGKVAGTVKVKDLIPQGTKFRNGSIRVISGTEETREYEEIDLILEGIEKEIAPEEEITVVFEVVVTGDNLVDGDNITNIAQIIENGYSKNTEAVSHKYMGAKITAEKKAVLQNEELGYAHEGEKIKYEIQIDNIGNLDGIAKIKDSIPDGTHFVDGSIKINEQDTNYTLKDLTEDGININVLPENMEEARKLKIMSNPPKITYNNVQSESVALNYIENSYYIPSVTEDNKINDLFTSYDAEFWIDGEGINGYNQITKKNPKDENPLAYTIEFTFNGKEFLVGLKPKEFRIYVDEGNGYELTSYEGIKGEDKKQFYLVQFEDRKQRNIKIELCNRFYGIVVSRDDVVSKITRESKPKALFMGDAMAYINDLEKRAFYSYPTVISDILGLECMNSSASGIGYIADDSGSKSSFYEKLQTLVERLHPNIVVFQGGRQDRSRGFGLEETVNNADLCFKWLQENHPEIQIIVLGGWVGVPVDQVGSSTELKINEEIKAKTLEYHIPYIDFVTGETISADGKILNNIGPYITAENVGTYTNDKDLTIDGQRWVGEILADEIFKILNNVTMELKSPITLSFEVEIDNLEEGKYYKEILNTANVNDSDTNQVVTKVRKPNINITKTATPDENIKVIKGTEITYSINLQNSGGEQLDVLVMDSIPEGTQFNDGSIKIDGVSYPEKTIDDLTQNGIPVIVPEGKTIKVEFTVTVTGENITNAEKTITNIATVDGKKTNEVTHHFVEPDVTGTKEAKVVEATDGREYAIEGETIKYTITLLNNALTEKTIKVKDIIPVETSFITDSIIVEPYQEKNYTKEELENEGIEVTVPAKTNDVPGEATITFKVTVKDLPENIYNEVIKNQAVVDGIQTNAVYTEVKKPNVVATKTATPADGNVKYGQKITYTINLDNTLGTAEGKISLADVLPKGVQYIDSTLKILVDGKPETHSIDDLTSSGIQIIIPEGKTAKVSFDVRVTGDELKNNEIISNKAQVNGEYTNEVKHTFVHEEPTIKTEITKEANVEKITSKDDTITYTITYTYTIDKYRGNAEVTIVDQLPYLLDESKIDENSLDGGEYSKDNKTITWSEKLTSINTYTQDDENENKISTPYTAIFKKTISISYKDPNVTQASIKNTVNGTITLLDVDDKKETATDTAEVLQSYLTNIRVKKVWKDNDNIAEKRPSQITVQVYNGSEMVKSKELTETDKIDENTMEYLFTDLQKYNSNGDIIQYTIDELDLGNIYYTKNITPLTFEKSNNEYTGTITNTFNVPGEKNEIVITKEWEDNDNQAGKRPSYITVQIKGKGEFLQEDGTYAKENIITENLTGNDWSKTIEVPKYDSKGNEINYTLDEILENEFYVKKSAELKKDLIGNKYTGKIINTFTVPIDKTSVEVKKIWEDNLNANGIRPSNLLITLTGTGIKGTEKGTITTQTYNLSADNVSTEKDNVWEYTFNNLPKYDDYGNNVEYTVDEVIPESVSKYYTKSIAGTVITNTLNALEEGKIVLTKVDNTESKTKLKGARFVLKDSNGTILNVMKVGEVYRIAKDKLETVLETNSEGNITIEGLPIGKYTLEEIKTPDGYIINGNSTHEFEIKLEDYKEKDGELVFTPISLEVVNDAIQIQIRKLDENLNDLNGATLELLNEQGEPVYEWESEETPHIISPIKAGTYTLREKQPPEGYNTANDKQIVVQEIADLQKFEMVDTLAKVKLEITKVDARNKDIILPGAEFKLVRVLKDENGKWKDDERFTPMEAVTDDNGKIVFEDLLYGTYMLYETKAPGGYNLIKKGIQVVIDSTEVDENNTVKLQVKNTEKTILPETGSIQTIITIIIGIVLIKIGSMRKRKTVRLLRKKSKKKGRRI